MGLLMLAICVVLLFIFLGSAKKEFEEYFERHLLPDGNKVSLITWVGRSMLVALVVGCIYGYITRDGLSAIGWAFVILLIVAWGGPYAEFALAWYRDKPNKLL